MTKKRKQSLEHIQYINENNKNLEQYGGGIPKLERGQSVASLKKLALSRRQEHSEQYVNIDIITDVALDKYKQYNKPISKEKFYIDFKKKLDKKLKSGTIKKEDWKNELKLERSLWKQEKDKAKTHLAYLAFAEKQGILKLAEGYNNIKQMYESSTFDYLVLRFNRGDNRKDWKDKYGDKWKDKLSSKKL